MDYWKMGVFLGISKCNINITFEYIFMKDEDNA